MLSPIIFIACLLDEADYIACHNQSYVNQYDLLKDFPELVGKTSEEKKGFKKLIKAIIISPVAHKCEVIAS